MNVNEPIRLLIVENSTTDAEACNSVLRSAGVAVRSYYFEADDDITELIDKHDPAVITLCHNHSEVTVQDLNSYISTLENPIPIVLLYAEDDADDIDFSDALRQGASDVVCSEHPDYLSKVIVRCAQHHIMEREFKTLSKMYEASEARCKSLLHSSKDAIAYVHEGVHVFANATYLERHGFNSFEDIEGLPLMDLVPDAKQADLKTFLRDLDVSQDEVHHPLTFKMEDGSEQEDDVEFSATHMDGESCIQLIIRHIEVGADTSALEEKITQLSTRDQLTGLLNRTAFMETFEKRLAEMASKPSLQFAYFHISIDQFEEHTNALGIIGRDELLKQTSQQLQSLLTDEHPICRYHSGMFSYLSAITNHSSEAKDIATYLLSCLDSVPRKINGHTLSDLSFNIGICIVDDPSISTTEAIERGEKALKTTSKDEPFVVYQPEEGELTQAQLDKSWEAKIDSALKNKRLQVHYRPMLHLDGSLDPSYQASLKMRDDNDEKVPTKTFMDVAERTGYCAKLDLWTIQECFKATVKALPKHPKLKVFIRLSNHVLGNNKLWALINKMIGDLKIPAGTIVFELEYAGVKDNIAGTQSFMSAIEASNCALSVYGVELSSDAVNAIQSAPWSFIKFHKESTTSMPTADEETKAHSRELFEALTAKGAHSIMTHVKDPMAMSVIWTSGCSYMQGDFIGENALDMTFDFANAMG